MQVKAIAINPRSDLPPETPMRPTLSYLTCTAALLFTTLSCGAKNPVSVSIKSNSSQTLTVPAGTEFSVTLQSIGPGEYASPPTVSSGAVQFLDVSVVGPYVPAGPTQQFRFNATTRGNAIIVFQHTGGDIPPGMIELIVEDTVRVL
jgi:hypothetical protein